MENVKNETVSAVISIAEEKRRGTIGVSHRMYLRASAHYDPLIAKKIGIPCSILLSRIIWSINTKIENYNHEHFYDENWWMYNSREQFADFFGMGMFQLRNALKNLQEKNLVLLKKGSKDDPLKRTLHYALNLPVLLEMFPHLTVPYKKAGKETAKSICMSPTNASDGNQQMHLHETDRSICMSPTNVTKSPTKNPPKNQTKNIGGGDENEPTTTLGLLAKYMAGKNAPPLNNFSSNLEKETARVIPLPTEDCKNVVSEAERKLGDEWYAYASMKAPESTRIGKFRLERFHTAISKIVKEKGRSLRELEEAFLFLKSRHDRKLSDTFLSPEFHNMSWGQITLLEETFLSMQRHKEDEQEKKYQATGNSSYGLYTPPTGELKKAIYAHLGIKE